MSSPAKGARVSVLEYSKTDPPRRRGFALAGFWVAAVSCTLSLTYVAILVLKIRDGAQAVTFRLSTVQLLIPVDACVLCLIGWSRVMRRLAAVGIALAALSVTAMLVMGSRFWP